MSIFQTLLKKSNVFKILINLSDKKFRELKLENLFENLTFIKIKKIGM